MNWLMRMLVKGKKNKRGFTLIELMVVVIVVGILAAAAVPIYRFAMSRAYSSEAKATMGTIRAAELVYYTENNETYLAEVSTDVQATDLLTTLGVDTTTNTWWHAGYADGADTNSTFGFGLLTAVATTCPQIDGTDFTDVLGTDYYVYVIGTDTDDDLPIEGIQMALNVRSGEWAHVWP